MNKFSRRHILRTGTAFGAAAGCGIAQSLGGFAAQAADTSGYKALVCVFMRGGLDGHDTLLPFDTASYNRFADLRSNLINAYNQAPDGNTRLRSALQDLAPANSADFGGRAFALPQELSGMRTLFEQENAAIIANVGPLIEPLNRTQFRERTRQRPSRLFSHNDQQSTWTALAPEGQRFGWGGRFADAMLSAGANANPAFTAISVRTGDVFLSGESTLPYRIDSRGSQTIRELENRGLLGSGRNSDVAMATLEEHFRAQGVSSNSILARDVAAVGERAVTSNAVFNEAFENAPEFTTPFPDTGLASNLRAVATTINARASLGVNRQIFIVSVGGFDTHSAQWRNMPRLQTQLSGAISAFFAAMQEMGVENDVTLFTASDFGRTMIANGDGSDHGWGGHHFVVGGAVNGGRIFGDVPPAEIDHSQDSGRGRLIPTTSVEQYAAPLGRWFGLNDAEVAAALPNLQSFDAPPNFI